MQEVRKSLCAFLPYFYFHSNKTFLFFYGSSSRAPLDLLQAQLLAQLAQLPALTMHQPQPWDLSGPLHFLHQGYHLLFLDTTLAPQLAPFLDHTFEKVKLINPRQPAVKITFYDKHKYWLLKNPQISLDRRASEINHYLQLLTTQQQQLTQRSLLPGSSCGPWPNKSVSGN